MEEVRKHITFETGIWSAYNDSVYDFTDFVHRHPGGDEKMIMAAG